MRRSMADFSVDRVVASAFSAVEHAGRAGGSHRSVAHIPTTCRTFVAVRVPNAHRLLVHNDDGFAEGLQVRRELEGGGGLAHAWTANKHDKHADVTTDFAEKSAPARVRQLLRRKFRRACCPLLAFLRLLV